MKPSSRSILLLVFAALLAAGVSAAPDYQETGPVREVIAAFLDAWGRQDYEGMYNLVSRQSQGLYAQSVFQTRYQDAAGALVLDGLTHTIREVHLQGLTAAARYDVTLTSSVFGDIVDRDRTIRLVREDGGWRIAWSSLDIFDGLAANARLIVGALQQPRANIYDRNGQVLVEQNGTTVALYTARADINEDDCLDLFSHVLARQRSDLVQWFAPYVAETVFYVGEVDPEIYNAREQQLTEVCAARRLEQETRRYFGHGTAAHITGYIGQIPASELDFWLSRGYAQGDLVGLAGVERAFDEQLNGRPERVLRIVEPGGTVLRELGEISGTPPQAVMLTIDRDLQHAAGQALADAYSFADPNWGGISPGAGAVVIDVNTGAILALASFPTFDPGVFNPDTFCCSPASVSELIAELNTDPRQPLFNRVTQGQYSPGSVFKIVTTAAVLDAGVFAPGDIFDCQLEWNGAQYGDTLPARFDWRLADELPPTGEITPAQALTASCDPFYYESGARLFQRAPTLLADYARRMGLGVRTGLDPILPEARGNLAQPASIEAAINNAIGQGDLQLTPIQMAMLVAAVANGGTLYRPYIVEQVGGLDGQPVSQTFEPTVAGELGLSQAHLDLIHAAMCAVTTDTDLGTAWFVFDDADYLACGKTGTAQTNSQPNAWFVAYAPGQAPEIAVVVMSERSREGSEVAAPIARRIIDHYLGEPATSYPEWWNSGPYIPITIPVGGTAGG